MLKFESVSLSESNLIWLHSMILVDKCVLEEDVNKEKE